MDKYKAKHHLYHSPPDWDLKVFRTFPANVKYHAALLESPIARELLKEDSCFEKKRKKMEFDDLLMFYLKPVTVSS